jgi:hypothetical protein
MSSIDTEQNEISYTEGFLQFLLKIRFPNGKNPYFHHVHEMLEAEGAERAVLVLSEILRGPRFTHKYAYWIERITFWIDSHLEHDADAFGGIKLLPHCVFYHLTSTIAFDESCLLCILDPPVLK